MVTPGLLNEIVVVRKSYWLSKEKYDWKKSKKYDFSICFHAVDICNDNKDKLFP